MSISLEVSHQLGARMPVTVSFTADKLREVERDLYYLMLDGHHVAPQSVEELHQALLWGLQQQAKS